MYTEDDLLAISALQHLLFCERQWGLIHLEGVWAENRLTVEGKQLHERVDESETEVRGDVRIARGLRVRSLRLGIVGRADVVEFRREQGTFDNGQLTMGSRGRVGDASPPGAELRREIPLVGVAGLWVPFPVEYKRGKPKGNRCDEVQLCAQALCLEEMLSVAIPAGAFFYGTPRRRFDVAFDAELRGVTERLIVRLHELSAAGVTPRAGYEKKCDSCSLAEVCLPKSVGAGRSGRGYLARAVR